MLPSQFKIRLSVLSQVLYFLFFTILPAILYFLLDLLSARFWSNRTIVPSITSPAFRPFLNQNLGSQFPGDEITRAETKMLNAQGGMSEVIRVTLTSKVGKFPSSMILKKSGNDKSRLVGHIIGIGRSEVRFYAELQKEVPIDTANCYFRVFKPVGRFAMLMEDLATQNIKLLDIKSVNVTDVYCGIQGLAKLHAKYWNSSRFKTDLAWVNDWKDINLLHLGLKPSWKEARRLLGCNFTFACQQIMDLIIPDIPRFHALNYHRLKTLCHGDFRLDNLFIRDGKIGAFDWQAMSIRNGTFDLAYFLCANLPLEMVESNEEKFRAYYYEELTSAGVKNYSREDFKRDYTWEIVNVFIHAVMGISAGDYEFTRLYYDPASHLIAKAITRHNIVSFLRETLGGS